VRISIFENLTQPLIGTFRFANGLEALTPQYDAILSWGIVITLSLFVLVCGFFVFNFYALMGVSVFVFGLVLTAGMFSYNTAFYVFVFCLVAYLIKHLNTASLGGKRRKSPFVLYAMPFTAICLVVAIAMPTPHAGYAAYVRENFITRPFAALNQSIQAALHPRYFSLAQTGFGGGAMRNLGGNVTADYGRFMRINPRRGSMPVYLRGVAFDTYTGNSWLNTFDDDYYVLTFESIEQNLEVFEMMSSALTMWTAADELGFFETYNHFEEQFLDIGITLSGEDWELVERALMSDSLSLFEHGFSVTIEGHYYLGEDLARAVELINLLFLDQRPFFYQGMQAVFDYFWNSSYGHVGNTLMDIVTTQVVGRSILFEHDFRTFNIFTAGVPVGISPLGNDMGLLRDGNGAVLTETLMRRGARYTVDYIEVGNNINTASVLAASRAGVLEDAWARVMQAEADMFDISQLNFEFEHLNIDFDELLYTYLIPRAARMREHYTQLPYDMPPRVAELARYVTQDAENDFERAIMVREFLRDSGHFEYTLTPGPSPSYRDFVDHFLFDLQTGYCVHFATAFTVMMRALDIPARYVEGFMVSGASDSAGYVNVINRQGHAWSEVYFEGFGWYLFEPTPPGAVFSTMPRTAADDAVPAAQTQPRRDFPELSGNFYEGEWDPYAAPAGGAATPPAGGEGGGQANNAPAQPMNVGSLFLTAILLMGSGVFAIMLLRLIVSFIKDSRIRRMDNNAAAEAYYAKILKYLDNFNFAKNENDTPLEFAQRISGRMSFENETIMMEDIAFILYRARYSDRPVTAEERGTLERVLAALDVRLKGYMGKWRFYVSKYVLVKF